MTVCSSLHQDYLKKIAQKKKKITLYRILILVLFLVLWETAAGLNWIDSFIFSSPSRIADKLVQMTVDGSLIRHTCVTLFETLASFFLTILIGTAAAVILWCSPTISKITEPYLVLLNSLPKSALAPLLIVWLGSGTKTIIVSGISVAIFGMILNLYTGFREIEPDKIKLIYTLRGSKRDVLCKVILPGTRPLFLSIMKVNIGLCLVGVIIGEFIGSRMGLGYLIIYGSQTFQLSLVITSIFVLCMISLILYSILNYIEKKQNAR